MGKGFLRIMLGGVISVAVLLLLALVWTLALELLNRRSDGSVAAGLVLLAVVLVVVLAAIHYGVRRILAAREEANLKRVSGEEPRAICESLFTEDTEGFDRAQERSPEKVRNKK